VRRDVKTQSDVAVEKFLAGYSCPQAILYAFCPGTGLDQDMALRLSCGFGAGIARQQEICGAIAGGIMAIGLKYGRGEGQDRTRTEETYKKVCELIARFETKHGTHICRALLFGCDLNTPEGLARAKQEDFHNRVCPEYVRTVAEALMEIL
jgi:C_GCAxxG_C_C family probable redox protein